MMLRADGSLWATGYNLYGQLGDGSTTNSRVFRLVLPDSVKSVSAGDFHNMIIKQDGSIWATGSNKFGQFGDGTTTSTKRFVKISPFGKGAATAHIFMTPRFCEHLIFFAQFVIARIFNYFRTFNFCLSPIFTHKYTPVDFVKTAEVSDVSVTTGYATSDG